VLQFFHLNKKSVTGVIQNETEESMLYPILIYIAKFGIKNIENEFMHVQVL
jgi:hypothetical protein